MGLVIKHWLKISETRNWVGYEIL
jgi:hypothetical protein